MSAIKFGRNYQLSVELPNSTLDKLNQELLTADPATAATLTATIAATKAQTEYLVVDLPITIEFDITRNVLSSANVCQIRIYNLSKFQRDQIQYNAYNNSQFRGVLLKGGYGDNLATIFTGNISQAWSVREGVNFVTQIECYDGGFAFVNGDVSISFIAGTPKRVIIETIMRNYLPGIDFGTIGDFPDAISKGETYTGNPAQILIELTGGAFFVDNGKSYALKSDEYIQNTGIVNVIDASSGLLNTPVLEQTTIRMEMLFEPSLNAGTLINLNSTTAPNLNGVYKVTSIKHRGTISGAVAGNAITTAEFFYSKELTPVVAV